VICSRMLWLAGGRMRCLVMHGKLSRRRVMVPSRLAPVSGIQVCVQTSPRFPHAALQSGSRSGGQQKGGFFGSSRVALRFGASWIGDLWPSRHDTIDAAVHTTSMLGVSSAAAPGCRFLLHPEHLGFSGAPGVRQIDPAARLNDVHRRRCHPEKHSFFAKNFAWAGRTGRTR